MMRMLAYGSRLRHELVEGSDMNDIANPTSDLPILGVRRLP